MRVSRPVPRRFKGDNFVEVTFANKVQERIPTEGLRVEEILGRINAVAEQMDMEEVRWSWYYLGGCASTDVACASGRTALQGDAESHSKARAHLLIAIPLALATAAQGSGTARPASGEPVALGLGPGDGYGYHQIHAPPGLGP